MKHERIGFHREHVSPQGLQRQVAHIVTIQSHDTTLRICMAHKQVGNGRLAYAAFADDRNALTGRNAQRHAVQHRRAIERECDIVQLHITGARIQGDGLRRVTHFHWRLQDLLHTRERHPSRRDAGIDPH